MFSCATGAPRSLTLLCAIALLLVVPVRSTAQSAGPSAGPVRTALTGVADNEQTELTLLVGRSTVVNVGQPIQRVSLTRPEIADVVVTGTQQLLVHGKTPGTISMFVWNNSGAIKRYDVTVARDLTLLEEQLKQLFPGEPITVVGNGKSVVVSGTVSSKYVIDKAADVAAGYVEKKDDVVNLLRQQEGVPATQVMLRVRFAEVSRSAVTELGASFFTKPTGYKDYTARTTTQQFAAPTFDDGKLVFSDFLNFFLFKNKEGLGTVIRALQTRGLFQSLAEPNLVTENGKEASFLAGGEYPYPVVQGTGSNLAVTIVFKEFGIRLNFTPTLMGGDLVHLKVRPEVSTLDFGNSITYQGFRIPALSTRRADTEIELADGQTFAIAGLLNNTLTSTLQKIPGIGDIPILGLLFRSKAAQKNQTELVVMITPQILRRGSTGAATGLPNLVEPYLGPPSKTYPNPPARLPGPGSASQQGGAPQRDDNPPAPAPVAPTPQPRATSPAPTPQPAPVATRPAAGAVTQAVNGANAAPVVVMPGAPARATVAAPPAPAPDPPKVDEKQLAAQRKAAEQAAKELRERQEAEGRELAKQRELDEKRRAQEARLADERKKAEAKAAEEEHKAELKRAEEQVKAERERLTLAQKQADEARKRDDKAAKERAKRDAEVARQVADAQKKQNEAEKKRLKEIQDAVDRLNAAQAAYQAAVQKVKKDGGQPQQQQ